CTTKGGALFAQSNTFVRKWPERARHRIRGPPARRETQSTGSSGRLAVGPGRRCPRLALGIIECQMLDDRKAAILRVVVEEYIETAQPVGSSHVAAVPDLSVSSATVRNEMAVLERDGYLVQPHTSAGRIPTDKGYRFFVDSIVEPGPLGPAQRQQIKEFFAKAHGELEQMLQDTSRLLSGLTDYAAVVVAPSHEVATIRSAQLVGLAPRVA